MSNKLAEDSLGSKGKVCELAKDRLYFLTTTTPPLNHGNYHFFCVDNIYEYRGFYADFGPLHIANTAEYCRLLKGLLESPRFNDKIIVHYTSTEPDKRTNAACLMAAFSILYFKKSVEDAYRPFSRLSPPLASFRDAAYGSCSFKLSVLDVLRGLSQALLHNWIDYEKFDCEHYRHHERIFPFIVDFITSSISAGGKRRLKLAYSRKVFGFCRTTRPKTVPLLSH
eukprot:m.107741 g.107741  ORF g.107741 m.107741 type:complete len:225 (+) comp13942_c0_seq1:293-967(+)